MKPTHATVYPGGLIFGWTYIRVGLYPGGLISAIIYSLANGWVYIRGGLKTGGGALKLDFMVFLYL